MSESAYSHTVSKLPELTNKQLDDELESAAILNEQSEMLLCVYLAEVSQRGAYRDFAYDNIYDYANARFGFGGRKTRYLVSLGKKLENLPKIRAALANGSIGWVKASRIAPHANVDNEVMWLDSALSLSVQQLEQRIKDGTDSLATMLHLPLTEERRILWENLLEVYRRRAGAEISPAEAFEYMCAEALQGCLQLPENEDAADEQETVSEAEVVSSPDDGAETVQGLLFETERSAEADFLKSPSYEMVRGQVLNRDGWRCAYPGCGARAHLEVHHIRYRSQGGSDAAWNLTTICHFHHGLIHVKQIDVKGRAPLELEWTPPKLMRDVLERRRNHPSIWLGDLDVREWALEKRGPASAAGRYLVSRIAKHESTGLLEQRTRVPSCPIRPSLVVLSAQQAATDSLTARAILSQMLSDHVAHEWRPPKTLWHSSANCDGSGLSGVAHGSLMTA